MDGKNETIVYGDDYWEEQVKARETKPQAVIDPDGLFFWGFCVVTGLTILFGPTALALLGII